MAGSVAEAGSTDGYGVYNFIQDLIVEGKDAKLVNREGRYVIWNWPRASDRYADFKAKKNPHRTRKNLTRPRASNDLMSALLNFYKKEGAREYKESKKCNEKGEVVKREFQMPPRVFESLFGNKELSKLLISSEEQDGQERERHLSEGSAEAQASSSDTGFDEIMDLSCGSSEPSDSASVGGFLPNASLQDSPNFESEGAGTHPPDRAFETQMEEDADYSVLVEYFPGIRIPMGGSSEPFDSTIVDNFLTNPSLDNSANFEFKGHGTHHPDGAFETQVVHEDEVHLAVAETFSETSFLKGGVREICPASGSIEGGIPFKITLARPLPHDVLSRVAEFEGVGTVTLEKDNPFTLSGYVPAASSPGRVDVKVQTSDDQYLGSTVFTYIDKDQEAYEQFITSNRLQSKCLNFLAQELAIREIKAKQDGASKCSRDSHSSIQAKQKQSVKILVLLVYTAAQTGAKQFVEMIFNSSAQRIVFDSYKDRALLPEDVARANGHCSLAQYLQDVTIRLTKEVDDQPKAIDWLELLKAVQNQVSVSQDKESTEETTPAESDGNSSDYFADTETSSCGSFEDNDVFTSNSEGKDAAEEDSYTGESKERLSKDPPCSSIPEPPDYEKRNGSFLLGDIHVDVNESFVSGAQVHNQDNNVKSSRDRSRLSFTFLGILFAVIILIPVAVSASPWFEVAVFGRSTNHHMASNRGGITVGLVRHPKVQKKFLTQICECLEQLRQYGSNVEVSCTQLPQIFLLQYGGTNETVTVSRMERLQCRHHDRCYEVKGAAGQDCTAGVIVKHCINANSNMTNVPFGFSCTLYFVSLHVSGRSVVAHIVPISQCAPHSFQPCQFYEQQQDEMADPIILEREPSLLPQCCHGEHMQCYQINETFNHGFLSISSAFFIEILVVVWSGAVDIKRLADSQRPFHAENPTHQQIYQPFNQCSSLANRVNNALTNQTASDKELRGFLPRTEGIFTNRVKVPLTNITQSLTPTVELRSTPAEASLTLMSSHTSSVGLVLVLFVPLVFTSCVFILIFI